MSILTHRAGRAAIVGRRPGDPGAVGRMRRERGAARYSAAADHRTGQTSVARRAPRRSRVGALGSLSALGHGAAAANSKQHRRLFGDLLTDEWKSGDTFAQHNEADQRTVQNEQQRAGRRVPGRSGRRAAGRRNAIDGLQQFSPELTGQIGEMYFLKAYAELILSEDFCNGIPFGKHG